MTRSSFISFITIAKIFGIVPCFIKQNNSLHRICNNIYPVFIICILHPVYLLYLPEQRGPKFGVLFYLCIMLTAIGGSITKRKIWIKLIKLTEITDCKMADGLKARLNINRKVTIPFFSYLTVFTLLPFLFPQYRVYVVWQLMQKCFLSYFIILFLIDLQEKFKVLNNRLGAIYEEHEIELFLVQIKKNNEMNYLKRLFKNLYDISVCCNEVFNWIIGMLFLDLFLFICSSFHVLINIIMRGELQVQELEMLLVAYLSGLVSPIIEGSRIKGV